MIELSGIYKYYPVGDGYVRGLHNVSLSVADSEFVGIVGPSGSGKSTLMNIIGCLDVADVGEYALNNYPIERYSETDLAMIRNRMIGFVFQSFNLIGRMSIEENIELPLIYQGIGARERRARVEKALAEVGLTDRRHHTPAKVSGGQQQRAAIARAIATEPALILADEPTGNLDSATGREIMDLFRRLSDGGKTIVLITHDAGVAARTDRTIHILDGMVAQSGEGGAA
ncbi:MAG: ABC transporter ATP-binding protein [Clostridiales Family XIII bacterium]|jgi:putative ABC transport system ATP-binding protein|nr:ABC transporter ATP-binding protein [Clostridiales Family XIII bacterium]